MILYGRFPAFGKGLSGLTSGSMNPLERRAVALLASIYALRMAGLFLILPVFALYATGLEGHTPFLIGIAIGAYGLTQAILQIPYGMLSDHLGRKPVIAAGLLIFALGSIIAASFVLSLILGPVLDGVIGVPGIFWMTGILAFVAIGIILFAVPTPVR